MADDVGLALRRVQQHVGARGGDPARIFLLEVTRPAPALPRRTSLDLDSELFNHEIEEATNDKLRLTALRLLPPRGC